MLLCDGRRRATETRDNWRRGKAAEGAVRVGIGVGGKQSSSASKQLAARETCNRQQEGERRGSRAEG
jgi:hypothetical protein